MRSNPLIGRMAASMQIDVFSTKSWRSTVPSGCAWDPFAIIKKGPSHFGVAGSFKSLHVSGEITEISAPVDYTNYKLDARPAFFCPEYLPYVDPADSDHVIPTLYAPVPVWVLSGPV
ncbi:hypothetical protein OUZ56_026006 [Daphnia magna]|uniref:Uncharacterized protein n=1 Tax=Daphnia magna TaxID=35525 RepID=A0ABQ9ZLC5_9CRUS|nr:hypothetical protein OUZ56_026006 [Daphnia magna]